jgi:hypothetical protein
MKYIQGTNREQISLFPTCLDDAISPEHEVRLIDVFVHGLDLEKMGFEVCHGENGRPAYHPIDLLKLYIYGYLNKIRLFFVQFKPSKNYTRKIQPFFEIRLKQLKLGGKFGVFGSF